MIKGMVMRPPLRLSDFPEFLAASESSIFSLLKLLELKKKIEFEISVSNSITIGKLVILYTKIKKGERNVLAN